MPTITVEHGVVARVHEVKHQIRARSLDTAVMELLEGFIPEAPPTKHKPVTSTISISKATNEVLARRTKELDYATRQELIKAALNERGL